MKKVLIIDDDLAILDALQITLEQSGYEVKTLSNGSNATAELTKFPADVVLLDIWMSGKDGMQIVEELKNHDHTKHVPVIMISALSEVKKATRESGADDYLIKPFSIQDVLKKIKKFTD